jgi:glucose dehydrogenase
MIYDTQTDLLIFGTGNPTPKGDPGWLAAGEDLYSDSIIAVTQTQVSTFGIIRRYPGGAWGMSDATGHIILADLPLAVGSRHVLMSAEKQLFYVLDARTGAFISVNAYLPNTNFSAMNSKTGKLTVRDYLSVWKHPGTAASHQLTMPADTRGLCVPITHKPDSFIFRRIFWLQIVMGPATVMEKRPQKTR